MTNGKIEVRPTVSLETPADLSRSYTPGVADEAKDIGRDPGTLRRHTAMANSVAVVTDGSALLGLGDCGPAAALPVMEGKAALFKRFAGVDAWPICLHSREPDDIVRTVCDISTGFGAINLEDISAPRCFEVERRLQAELDIPVFHDDQHGTAVVVLAALFNALQVTDRRLEEDRIVISGAGAAGSAIVRLLLHVGADPARIVVCDSKGALVPGRDGVSGEKAWLAEHTNTARATGSLQEVLRGADVFVGVSAAGLLSGEDVAAMADDPVVFALANPDPEVDPEAAREHAAVLATGRSDLPNQINNVLVFPGVLRGLLDTRVRSLTIDMQSAAAHALADVVDRDALDAGHIVPSVFDERVVPAVAGAVGEATL